MTAGAYQSELLSHAGKADQAEEHDKLPLAAALQSAQEVTVSWTLNEQKPVESTSSKAPHKGSISGDYTDEGHIWVWPE